LDREPVAELSANRTAGARSQHDREETDTQRPARVWPAALAREMIVLERAADERVRDGTLGWDPQRSRPASEA